MVIFVLKPSKAEVYIIPEEKKKSKGGSWVKESKERRISGVGSNRRVWRLP